MSVEETGRLGFDDVAAPPGLRGVLKFDEEDDEGDEGELEEAVGVDDDAADDEPEDTAKFTIDDEKVRYVRLDGCNDILRSRHTLACAIEERMEERMY